jgi:hypothetical protein
VAFGGEVGVSEPRFIVSIEYDPMFSKTQVWPDGDGPENPTAEDVAEVMRRSGGVDSWLMDWNMRLSVSVREAGNAAAGSVEVWR